MKLLPLSLTHTAWTTLFCSKVARDICYHKRQEGWKVLLVCHLKVIMLKWPFSQPDPICPTLQLTTAFMQHFSPTTLHVSPRNQWCYITYNRNLYRMFQKHFQLHMTLFFFSFYRLRSLACPNSVLTSETVAFDMIPWTERGIGPSEGYQYAENRGDI
jgi:hypothetical protein